MKWRAAKYWIVAMAGAALLSVAGLSLVGCGQNGGSTTAEPAASLGEPVPEAVPTLAAKDLSEGTVGQTVAVEGEVVQQCPSSGCWFRLKDATGEVFVELAPAQLNLKSNRVGQHAKVTGRVVKAEGQLQLEARHVAFGGGEGASGGRQPPDAHPQKAKPKPEKY